MELTNEKIYTSPQRKLVKFFEHSRSSNGWGRGWGGENGATRRTRSNWRPCRRRGWKGKRSTNRRCGSWRS